jgi:hypothetical protein
MANHDIAYCEGKARQCFRLADNCADKAVSIKLRQIGNEFVREALKLGADPSTMPPKWLRSAEDGA